eukprot:4237768-Amphidinium_carterae.1
MPSCKWLRHKAGKLGRWHRQGSERRIADSSRCWGYRRQLVVAIVYVTHEVLAFAREKEAA